MKTVEKERSEILQRLEKMTPEIEKGYPVLEKVCVHSHSIDISKSITP